MTLDKAIEENDMTHCQKEDCIHAKMCREVNSLPCRADFVWYDYKYGCPHYYSTESKRGAIQLIDEMLEGLQLVIDQEDTLGRNAWDEGDTAGYHIHQYAEERLETIKTALLLWKATKRKEDEGK